MNANNYYQFEFLLFSRFLSFIILSIVVADPLVRGRQYNVENILFKIKVRNSRAVNDYAET